MNTVNQTETHVLTDAQLQTVDGAMTAEQRYEWHLARQQAFRNGEEWRIPRPRAPRVFGVGLPPE